MNIHNIPNDVLRELEEKFSTQEEFEAWFKSESFDTDENGSIWNDVLRKLKNVND